MKLISEKLTNFIIKKGIIDKEDYALYQYGLQTGLEMMVCLILSIIIACRLDILFQSFVVAIVLFALRAYICGIHMKTYISCLFWSTSILTVGSYGVSFIPLSIDELFIICLILLPTIHKLSYYTVAYNSQPEEIAFFTKQRKRIIVGIFVIVVILFLVGSSNYMKQVCYALTVALISIIGEIIRIKIIMKREKSRI